MAKLNKENQKISSESESFEMIELAIDDIELLTKAFTVISKACNDEHDKLKAKLEPERILH